LNRLSFRQIAFGWSLSYDFHMQSSPQIVCDACGQPAEWEHIAQRLKRLENMTRHRPIHIQVLFLGAISPADGEYLYSAQSGFTGEGARLLRALDFDWAGRAVEITLTEFQRRGYLLAHVVECAGSPHLPNRSEALQRRIPATIARIRRSFKPKRIVLLGTELAEFVPQFRAANLDADLILRDGKPFSEDELCDGLLAKELAARVQAL
jgi:uracil-DNA glycosylase